MNHPRPSAVSAVINASPALARLGPSVRDARLRERGTYALICIIAERLGRAIRDMDVIGATKELLQTMSGLKNGAAD